MSLGKIFFNVMGGTELCIIRVVDLQQSYKLQLFSAILRIIGTAVRSITKSTKRDNSRKTTFFVFWWHRTRPFNALHSENYYHIREFIIMLVPPPTIVCVLNLLKVPLTDWLTEKTTTRKIFCDPLETNEHSVLNHLFLRAIALRDGYGWSWA